MHIVVTGATGNVGTSVLEALGKEPAVRSITALARRAPGMKARKTYFVAADVAEEQLGPIFEGADAVIHLAWQFHSPRRAEELWSTNVLGSRRVFDAVRQAGVPKLIHASSFAAYAAREGDDSVDETFPITGIQTSTYSRHTVEVERRLDEFEAKNPKISVVRFRPSLTLKRSAASSLLRRFAGPLLPRAAFGQVAQRIARELGSTRLPIVHSRDVADALRLAVLADVRGAFNLAPRAGPRTLMSSPRLGAPVPSPSARAVLRAAAIAFKLGLHRTDPSWMDLAMQSPELDDSRARAELGYSPRYTSEEVVAEVLAGLRDGAGLDTPPLRPNGRPSAQLSNSAHVSVQYPTS